MPVVVLVSQQSHYQGARSLMPRTALHLWLFTRQSQAAHLLARVQSSRVKDYVRELATLAPWRCEPAVREFIHRPRKEIGVAA